MGARIALRFGAQQRCLSARLQASGSPDFDLVHASRQALIRKLPVQVHRIAGVTFEDRQKSLSLLAQLKLETISVMLEKEPDNPYDPNAIAVKLVDDTKLGYIPRTETSAFVHSLCFGRVRSIGHGKDTPNYGCIIEVQPKLPPVVNLSIPMDLVDQCSDFVGSLSGTAWDVYRADLCRRLHNRCSISNAETNNVEARWSVRHGVVKLVGFALQHPFLRGIQYINSNEFIDLEDTCKVIGALNPGMTYGEASTVFTRQVDLSERRAGAGWRLDTSLTQALLEGR